MRIGVYVRVSTANQVQNQTIEQQLDRVRRHLAEQGDELATEQLFRDDGYSGARLRSALADRLREAIREGELDRLLVTAPDRLVRNSVHQMRLIEEFEQCGCQVEFLDHPMSHDPHDQVLLQIRGAVAEDERALITERMRRGRQAKPSQAACGHLAALDPTTLRLPSTPRASARSGRRHPRSHGCCGGGGDLCPLRGTGSWAQPCSRSRVPCALHARGICSPTGHAWWGLSSLRGLLTNPIYVGSVYAGRLRYRPPRVRQSATHPLGRPHDSGVVVPPEAWLLVAVGGECARYRLPGAV